MALRRSISVTVQLGAVALVTAIVACSSSSSRAPFADDAGASPPPTTDEAPPPTDTAPAPTGPTAPVGDASTPPDAPDDCKKTPPSNACGLVPQCGCTLAETCDVSDASGNVACVTAGKAAMGAPCTTTAGCARGLSCVFGTCHAFCDNAGSACTAAKTGQCVQVQAQGGTAVPNYEVCYVDCDLRDPAACGGTTAAGTGVCFVDDKGNTDCQKGGTRAQGEACSPTDDCGPGLVCVTVSGTSTCKKWCRVGMSSDCGGASCTGFGTKVMVKGVEYGACP